MNQLEEVFGPVISVYTREMALDDGVLVELPCPAGLQPKAHICCTNTVYEGMQKIIERSGSEYTWESLTAKLVIEMCHGHKEGNLSMFRVMINNQMHSLKCASEVGTYGNEFTFMQPDED